MPGTKRNEATNDERRTTNDGSTADRGEINDERDEDPSGVASANQQLQPHRKGLAMICDEILRRNVECNEGASADLFSPRDGFALPPFRWSDERRPLIRAELDARIAWCYCLARDNPRYIRS